MTLPNFLIIGAAKAGTTSLYKYLKQHPEIYMSPLKETGFFFLENLNKDEFDREIAQMPRELRDESIAYYKYRIQRGGITNIEDYLKLFEDVSTEKAIGEATPGYMYYPIAVEKIKYYVPNAKLIAILRNPADRAYSAFLHRVKSGREPIKDFQQALDREDISNRYVWSGFRHYVRQGFYYEQLKAYFETFDSSQIKIYLNEDLAKNTQIIMQDIFLFLGVNENCIIDTSTKHLVSAMPKNKLIHDFLTKPNPITNVAKALLPYELGRRMKRNIINQNMTKPPFPAHIRQHLIEIYREDILKLQDLICQDLCQWLE